MCPECKNEKVGFSDFHKQCMEFQEKGVRQYERLYTCSKCGKKYYLRENSKWKWLVIIPGFVWCVLWLLAHVLASSFDLPDLVWYIELLISIAAAVAIALPLFAIHWVISKKSHFLRWKWSSSTLVEDEEHWRYH